ncbi:hypothetical protein Dimus_036324 [Dionaea muscipula]
MKENSSGASAGHRADQQEASVQPMSKLAACRKEAPNSNPSKLAAQHHQFEAACCVIFAQAHGPMYMQHAANNSANNFKQDETHDCSPYASQQQPIVGRKAALRSSRCGPSSSYSAAHELSLQAAATTIHWCGPK